MTHTKDRRARGFTVIMATVSLFATMLIAGLGFDVGTLYLIRTKLQGAADAAALAAVRALAENGNMTAAQTVGTEFLAANFPTNYFGAQAMSSMPVASALTVSLINQSGGAGTAGTTATAKLVNVNVGVTAPLYFLRMLGQTQANIYATAQAKREGLLVMLVLDGSGSMTNLIDGTPACTYAINDAEAFLNNPQFDPDIDRIGVVTYSGNAYTVAPVADFQSPAGTVNTSSAVYTAIDGFQCHGNTNTSGALQAAYTAISNFYGAGVSPNRANVVILETDGAPNGFSANWATYIKSGSNCGAAASNPQMTGFVARETPTEWGIFSDAAATSSNMQNTDTASIPLIADNGKCQMDSDVTKYFQDFSQVPSTDFWGDQLTGGSTYKPTTSLLFSGDNPGQAGDEQQFLQISSNAADGRATAMRTDALLRISIYTIELDGNSNGNIYDYADPTLLQRMANATTSPIYNPAQPVGAYFDAQDATYLGAEFAAVASDISARLSK
jgi:Flp pilus assembly protein TadG